jgi:6,7-dimethyl-8-ribityllumazine synthase
MNQVSIRIAFIQSSWHHDIVDQSRVAFLKRIRKDGLGSRNVECFSVPGAFEIPLQAKLLAKSGRYDAIVGAGLVVDGGIYRHEFVAASVIDALMQVQLETEVPIISAVLTPHHYHAHDEHHAFYLRHLATKGEEAAAACLATIRNIRGVKKLKSG